MKSPVLILVAALAATAMSCGNKGTVNTSSNTAANTPATTNSPAANTIPGRVLPAPAAPTPRSL